MAFTLDAKISVFRNVYKTSGKYGQIAQIIDNERFIRALKQSKDKFPISNSADTIGYYVQQLSFQKLGESNLLKIIINAYKTDIKELKRIGQSRGTDLAVLLQSYNINYTD